MGAALVFQRESTEGSGPVDDDEPRNFGKHEERLMLASGTCSLDATQAGNANYTAASLVTQSFSVTPAAQVISFTNPGAQTYSSGGTVVLTATGGAFYQSRVSVPVHTHLVHVLPASARTPCKSYLQLVLRNERRLAAACRSDRAQ